MIEYDVSGIKFIKANINDAFYDIDYHSVDLIIADPPYYKIVKDTWDNQWETFDDYIIWCDGWLMRAKTCMKDNASLYLYGSIGEKGDAILHQKLLLDRLGLYFKDWITWKKSRGMGNRRGWLYTREELLWYVKDNKQFTWNIDAQYSTERRKRDKGCTDDNLRLGQNNKPPKSPFKRYTNVWEDISENVPEVLQSKHSTAKPYKITERLILAHTKEGDTVLDLFCGTGNAAIVCNRLGRKYIGIDSNEEYIEEAIQRLTNGT